MCHSLCGSLCELPRDRSDRAPAEWSPLFEEYDLLNENTDIIPDEESSETVWSLIRCTDVPGLRALIRDERWDIDLAKDHCDVTHGGTVLHRAAACATSKQAAKVLDLIVRS